MRTCLALLAAAFATVLAGVALAFALGGLTFAGAALAAFTGAAAGVLAFVQSERTENGPRIHVAEGLVLAAFALASLRAFLWVIYERDGSITVLSPNNLGDMALHLDFIRYFASGIPFWPESPILTGEPLRYPIGADFFNSILLVLGVPVERGLVWVGLAGAAITGAALWKWGRGFAIAAFLFSGGLAAFPAARDALASGHFVLEDFQADMAWKNLFLAMFVTQRALLFALPAGLFILDDWRSRFVRGTTPSAPAWVPWLLYAAMPLFSVHSFIFLCIALVGMFAFAASREARWSAVRFTVIAFVPATVCFALTTAGFGTTGGVHWLPGWMQADGLDKKSLTDAQRIWRETWFWFENFGLYLVLWAGLAGFAAVRGSRETRAIVLPASLMFLLCAFVSFAAWPWDNTKLLIWAWIAVAPCLWSEVLLLMPVVARAVVCVVLFFSGALSLAGGLDGRHGYALVKRPLVDATQKAVAGIDPNARFACAPEHWHPLILLGRKVAVGYEGHLWSHGLDYKKPKRELETLLDADPGWEKAIAALDVDYLYWGRPERQNYPASEKTWKKFPVAAKGDSFVIYDLRGAAEK